MTWRRGSSRNKVYTWEGKENQEKALGGKGQAGEGTGK